MHVPYALCILLYIISLLLVRHSRHTFICHGIYLLTKGAASICRYYIFATGSPPINKSQYLTSTYFSPQSKHFKKKCQPKYQNFENMKNGSVDRWSKSDCLIFFLFHHICYLYSQKQFKYLDIFNAETFEKLQTISCFSILIYAYSYKLKYTRGGKDGEYNKVTLKGSCNAFFDHPNG